MSTAQITEVSIETIVVPAVEVDVLKAALEAAQENVDHMVYELSKANLALSKMPKKTKVEKAARTVAEMNISTLSQHLEVLRDIRDGAQFDLNPPAPVVETPAPVAEILTNCADVPEIGRINLIEMPKEVSGLKGTETCPCVIFVDAEGVYDASSLNGAKAMMAKHFVGKLFFATLVEKEFVSAPAAPKKFAKKAMPKCVTIIANIYRGVMTKESAEYIQSRIDLGWVEGVDYVVEERKQHYASPVVSPALNGKFSFPLLKEMLKGTAPKATPPVVIETAPSKAVLAAKALAQDTDILARNARNAEMALKVAAAKEKAALKPLIEEAKLSALRAADEEFAKMEAELAAIEAGLK